MKMGSEKKYMNIWKKKIYEKRWLDLTQEVFVWFVLELISPLL